MSKNWRHMKSESCGQIYHTGLRWLAKIVCQSATIGITKVFINILIQDFLHELFLVDLNLVWRIHVKLR